MAKALLAGRIVGLSLNPPADLVRLGYPPREFDRLAFELAMRIIQAGGRVLYGGHLQPGSLTTSIFDHLAGAYAKGGFKSEADDRPFVHLLSSNEFARTPFSRLTEILRSFGRFAETSVVLDVRRRMRLNARRASVAAEAGANRPEVTGGFELELLAEGRWPREVSGHRLGVVRNQQDLRRFQDQVGISDHFGPNELAEAMSAMRATAEGLISARIAAGGKRGDCGVRDGNDLYVGRMPGIWEEVLKSLEGGHPTVVLGAYGGAAREAAIALGLLQEEDRVPFLGAQIEGRLQFYEKLTEWGQTLTGQSKAKLTSFAQRSDTEMLARDVVIWLAQQLGFAR